MIFWHQFVTQLNSMEGMGAFEQGFLLFGIFPLRHVGSRVKEVLYP